MERKRIARCSCKVQYSWTGLGLQIGCVKTLRSGLLLELFSARVEISRASFRLAIRICRKYAPLLDISKVVLLDYQRSAFYMRMIFSVFYRGVPELDYFSRAAIILEHIFQILLVNSRRFVSISFFAHVLLSS